MDFESFSEAPAAGLESLWSRSGEGSYARLRHTPPFHRDFFFLYLSLGSCSLNKSHLRLHFHIQGWGYFEAR